jgi:hypothetical protein
MHETPVAANGAEWLKIDQIIKKSDGDYVPAGWE